jgi:SAM-dependent methyltransferase
MEYQTDSSRKMFAKNMRCFHNKIKSSLITQAAQMTNGKALLDIGCGRGGDLFKWDVGGIEYVYAYDPNPAYIEEANRRLLSSHLKRNYVFSTDIYDSFDQSFDIVSCQFAVHYLFASDSLLNDHLKYIARMLKPGGVYIGTFMDGDNVLQRVKEVEKNCFSNQAMCVRIPSMNKIQQDTGVSVNVHLAGTLYFGEKSVSHEFLVKKAVLTQRCAEAGLQLIGYTPFKVYNNQMNFRMGSDFSECSYMYTSFMFQKKIT